MAWRAASCTASRSLYLGRAIPAVSTSSSFSSSFCAQSLRNPCRRARAPFKIQVRGRHAESTLEPFKIQVRGRHAESTLEPEIQSNKDESSSMKWKIKMLYDGECPLCMREVNMLRERNKLYGAIKFVDISSKDYTPEDNQGLDYRTVMGRIHAILSDGTVVTDVEAFRRLYEEVGLGWVYAITKYEPVASIANAVYGAWAKYRLQITGRPPLEDILASRKGNTVEICNDDKVCRM